MDRLAEIHNKEDEEQQDDEKTHDIVANADIALQAISFRYIGSQEPVLKNLTMEIPANKITAIVGVSGSGKTTLMKLLLKFYEPDEGDILLREEKTGRRRESKFMKRLGPRRWEPGALPAPTFHFPTSKASTSKILHKKPRVTSVGWSPRRICF